MAKAGEHKIMADEVRSPLNNPFAPGSDHVPEVWAGRQPELGDFTSVVAPRRLAGVYERGRVVLGEPGIGKSVLVNRIARTAAADGHWVTSQVRLAAGEDAVAHLAEALRDLVSAHSLDAALGRTAGGLLGRIEQITMPLIGGGVKIRGAAASPTPTAMCSASSWSSAGSPVRTGAWWSCAWTRSSSSAATS